MLQRHGEPLCVIRSSDDLLNDPWSTPASRSAACQGETTTSDFFLAVVASATSIADLSQGMTMFQTLIAMTALMGAVSVNAQVPLKMGTYLPESSTAPRLAIFPSDDGKWGRGGDICTQCLAGGPNMPRECLFIKCAPPSLPYKKILVPSIAKEMIEKSCGVNRLCKKENFEVLSGWPPKPDDPDPYERRYRPDQLTRPYKGFLELSRIDADKQLKTGALSKSDYSQIIKDYRADWKALKLAQ